MTKDARNPKRWSTVEIQQDSEGYVAAQQAYAEDQEAAVRQQQEADDKDRFVQRFVEEGGRERDAEAAYRTHRNQQAAEAAGRAENEALTASRDHVRQRL